MDNQLGYIYIYITKHCKYSVHIYVYIHTYIYISYVYNIDSYTSFIQSSIIRSFHIPHVLLRTILIPCTIRCLTNPQTLGTKVRR